MAKGKNNTSSDLQSQNGPSPQIAWAPKKKTSHGYRRKKMRRKLNSQQKIFRNKNQKVNLTLNLSKPNLQWKSIQIHMMEKKRGWLKA